MAKVTCDCQEIHAEAKAALHDVEHEDPAIVHIWAVVSAQNEVLCAMAECLHQHLQQQPHAPYGQVGMPKA